MKLLNALLFSTVFFIVMCCQSPLQKVKENFQTVDNSLTQLSKTTDPSIDGLYAQINSRRQNSSSLALQADSLYFTTKQAIGFIDSVKKILQKQDPSGMELTTATGLLRSTATGEKLKSNLLKVYETAQLYRFDSGTDPEMDKILQSFAHMRQNKSWTKQYFEQTPTVAALTLLSKFEYDCLTVARIILSDMNRQLTH